MKKLFDLFKNMFKYAFNIEQYKHKENITPKTLQTDVKNNLIGYQITDYKGTPKVYSQRHVFKTFLNAIDFADNNNFLCDFEVRPVYAEDINNPIYIDSYLCR